MAECMRLYSDKFSFVRRTKSQERYVSAILERTAFGSAKSCTMMASIMSDRTGWVRSCPELEKKKKSSTREKKIRALPRLPLGYLFLAFHMLYSEAIISKKGPLARVWLAAHWERKISKNQFLQTNIEKTVGMFSSSAWILTRKMT
jgi:hypothetical protein